MIIFAKDKKYQTRFFKENLLTFSLVPCINHVFLYIKLGFLLMLNMLFALDAVVSFLPVITHQNNTDNPRPLLFREDKLIEITT